MAGSPTKRLGEELIKAAFGASLYQQGRGFYVTLELLAILRGVHESRQPLLASPVAGDSPTGGWPVSTRTWAS